MKIRVLLADDHTLLRQGLRRSLEDAGVEVVGEAGDGNEAVLLSEQHRPDVVLMDVTMPRMGGVEATRIIRSRLPEVEVLFLTMHADASVVAEAARSGAAGYLVKDCTMDDIVTKLEAVARKESTLSPELASSILFEAHKPSSRADPSGPLLTQREEDVLNHIAAGMSTPEVAEALYISTKTVRHHLSSIYEKLDSRDRTEAVVRALRMGLIRFDVDHRPPENP